jgi:hypothetical protein
VTAAQERLISDDFPALGGNDGLKRNGEEVVLEALAKAALFLGVLHRAGPLILFADSLPDFHGFIHRVDQFPHGERLGHDADGFAAIDRLDGGWKVKVSRDQNADAVRLDAPHARQKLKAIWRGHGVIDDGDVEYCNVRGFQSTFAIVGGNDNVAFAIENIFNQLADACVVVHDKDAQPAIRHGDSNLMTSTLRLDVFQSLLPHFSRGMASAFGRSHATANLFNHKAKADSGICLVTFIIYAAQAQIAHRYVVLGGRQA